MQNQNSIDEYSNIFKTRRDNLESQKQQLQEEYIKELERLKQEQEERIRKLEEKENLLYAFEQLDVENITIEEIEDLLIKVEQLDLTDDELIIVMTRLTELSTLDLVKETEEEIKIEVKLEKLNEEEVQEEKKPVISDYYKEYIEKYEEYKKIIEEYNSLIEDYNNKDGIISSLKKQIQKDNNSIVGEYYNYVGRINSLKMGIESDSVFLIKTSSLNKKIINTKEEEIKQHFERIKEEVEKLKVLLKSYNEVYEEYRKELEDSIFEKLEESKKVTEIIEDTNIDDIINAKIPQELEIEDIEPEEIDEQEEIDEEEYENIAEETLQDFEITYDNALLLYNNMKQALEKGLIEESSYLYQLYFSFELLIQYRPPKNSTEADIVTATNNLRKTIMTIEGIVDDDLKEVLFPKTDQEHINVGPKNIIIFLDNNGEYLIEEDLNDMVSGDKKLAIQALENGIKTKITIRSWNSDLRERSHHLKGSKLKLGNEMSEARSVGCGSGKTRISVVPLSVNQEIKNKIKDTYNLDDELENVLLVGGITRTHRVDEDLKPTINNNSKRIKEINDKFNNSNTKFSEIEALINGSSELCEKLFENEKVNKGVK